MHIIGYMSHTGAFRALELESAEKAAALMAAFKLSGNSCCFYSFDSPHSYVSLSEREKIVQRMRCQLPSSLLMNKTLEEGISLLRAEKAVIETTTDCWPLDRYGRREE